MLDPASVDIQIMTCSLSISFPMVTSPCVKNKRLSTLCPGGCDVLLGRDPNRRGTAEGEHTLALTLLPLFRCGGSCNNWGLELYKDRSSDSALFLWSLEEEEEDAALMYVMVGMQTSSPFVRINNVATVELKSEKPSDPVKGVNVQ